MFGEDRGRAWPELHVLCDERERALAGVAGPSLEPKR
jgi:hypothetical protein